MAHPLVVGALVAVYAVPDANVGDQVMAALVLQNGASLAPDELTAFLSEQPDLPSTATNKVLKRELVAQGASAGTGERLWVREERGTAYSAG